MLTQQLWHVSDGYRSTGPHPHAELAAALADGRIPATALVWQDGWTQWLPASQFFAVPQPDPLAELASASQPQVYAPQAQAYGNYAPPGTQVNVYVGVQSRRRGMGPMAIIGLVMTLASIPLCCVFLPAGVVVFIVGLILLIVGLCT